MGEGGVRVRRPRGEKIHADTEETFNSRAVKTHTERKTMQGEGGIDGGRLVGSFEFRA